MVKFTSFTIATMLATFVASTPLLEQAQALLGKPEASLRKRGDAPVYFRVDLKSGQTRGSQYKGHLLSHRRSESMPGKWDITLVPDGLKQGVADQGIVKPQGISLVVLGSSITSDRPNPSTSASESGQYVSVGVDEANPKAKQPVNLDGKGSTIGRLYVQHDELRLTSTTPQIWDTWLICECDGYPKLWWAGSGVNAGDKCTPVKLFTKSV